MEQGEQHYSVQFSPSLSPFLFFLPRGAFPCCAGLGHTVTAPICPVLHPPTWVPSWIHTDSSKSTVFCPISWPCLQPKQILGRDSAKLCRHSSENTWGWGGEKGGKPNLGACAGSWSSWGWRFGVLRAMGGFISPPEPLAERVRAEKLQQSQPSSCTSGFMQPKSTF